MTELQVPLPSLLYQAYDHALSNDIYIDLLFDYNAQKLF